jgi:hypothetical protein
MKKLIFSLSMLLTITVTQAQSILLPNGDFENWTNLSYDNPDKWDNSNLYTVSGYGLANVSKVSGMAGGDGVKLETKVSGMDTVAAYISNSDDPITGDGGVPFTFQATNFEGMYKYNITAGDTAWIILNFKKNGSIISTNMYPITGSQSTATSFSFPVATMAQAPDTVIIAAVSGNVINSTPMSGSWLELDGLSFSDNTLWVSFQDGDFEDWTNFNVDNPNDWTNWGDYPAGKTTDKYTGSFALKLESKDDGTGYIETGEVILGDPNVMPGIPFTKTSDTLTWYYKYNATGTDAAMVIVTLRDANGMNIGNPAIAVLPVAANYSLFELPIVATGGTPANMIVHISSSDVSSTGLDGSTLHIDNIRLKNSPNSIGRIASDHDAFAVFPNPARDVLYIKPGKGTVSSATLHIYDMAGRIIGKHDLTRNFGGIMQVSIEGYTPGIYQYEIQSGDVVTRGKFVKE